METKYQKSPGKYNFFHKNGGVYGKLVSLHTVKSDFRGFKKFFKIS